MTVPDVSIGTPLSTHAAASRSLRVAFGTLGTLVLGAGLLMLGALGKVKAEDRGTVLAVAGGAAAAGAGILGGALMLGRGRRWVLGTEGVRFESGKEVRAYPFADLEETCQMMRAGVSVGLAFRTPAGGWESVPGRISGYKAFRDGVIEGYLRHRLPKLEAAVRSGGRAEFRMLTPGGRAQAAMATGIAAYLQLPTEPIRVDLGAVTVGEAKLPLAELEGLEGNPWTGRFSLLRRDGAALDLPAGAIFEQELLTALLARLAGEAAA